jgi:hypothetical protein
MGKNLVFGISKASPFLIGLYLREGLGVRLKLALTVQVTDISY